MTLFTGFPGPLDIKLRTSSPENDPDIIALPLYGAGSIGEEVGTVLSESEVLFVMIL